MKRILSTIVFLLISFLSFSKERNYILFISDLIESTERSTEKNTIFLAPTYLMFDFDKQEIVIHTRDLSTTYKVVDIQQVNSSGREVYVFKTEKGSVYSIDMKAKEVILQTKDRIYKHFDNVEIY